MKDGVYWVRRCIEWGWEIGELNHGYWYIAGSDDTYSEKEIMDIGDEVEKPDKYK